MTGGSPIFWGKHHILTGASTVPNFFFCSSVLSLRVLPIGILCQLDLWRSLKHVLLAFGWMGFIHDPRCLLESRFVFVCSLQPCLIVHVAELQIHISLAELTQQSPRSVWFSVSLSISLRPFSVVSSSLLNIIYQPSMVTIGWWSFAKRQTWRQIWQPIP